MLTRRFSHLMISVLMLVTTFIVSPAALGQAIQRAITKPREMARQLAPAPNTANETCALRLSTTPPFWVLNAPETKPYTDFSQRPDGSIINGYVPKGSIVAVEGDGPRLYTLPNTYIPIRVVSTPDAQTAENARRSPQEMARPYRGIQGTRVTAGTRGFIRNADLQKAGSNLFVVKQNSPLLQIGNQNLDLQGRTVRLATTLGQYKVNRCCPTSSPGSKTLTQTALDTVNSFLGSDPNCHDNYIFEVMSPDLANVERSFDMNLNQCEAFARGLEVIDGRQTTALAGVSRALASDPRFGFENVEYIPGAELLKIPNVPDPANPGCNVGPFGSCHYWQNPNNGASESARNTGAAENNSAGLSFDSYMHPVSACAFMRVLEEHQRTCQGPGCRVQWGDAYSNAAWNAHKSHGGNGCIDIRPLRRDASVGPINYNQANYDRQKTAAFIALLKRAGADTAQIGFSDPAMVSQHGTKAWGGHDNHIHVCFPHQTTRTATSGQVAQTQRTCQTGLNPAGQPAPAPSTIQSIFNMIRR